MLLARSTTVARLKPSAYLRNIQSSCFSRVSTSGRAWAYSWTGRRHGRVCIMGASPRISSSSGREMPPLPLVPDMADISAGMSSLKDKQAEWASLPLHDKADLLEEMKLRMADIAEEWAVATARVKGLEADLTVSPGELVKNISIVGSHLGRLARVLRHVGRTGTCPAPKITTLPSGQQIAKVFPSKLSDKIETLGIFGCEAELWIKPGMPATQGASLTDRDGGVCVVLAAGNHAYIGLMDAIEQLFAHNRVVLLKYHDVQGPMTPFIEYLLEPLRAGGYIWGVKASVEMCQNFLYHPAVTHVHITGGNAAHDAIVWGPPGPGREKRMKANDPLLKVPISSELGNISPWLITPGGGWTDSQLTHHAEALAEAVLDNCSANCLAAKVVLVSDGWEHTDQFLLKLKSVIREAPPLVPYYPGAMQRQAQFLEKYPDAEVIHSRHSDSVPQSSLGVIPVGYLELKGLPREGSAEHFLTVEPFAPVITVIRVPSSPTGASAATDFLQQAVTFCNETLWGNLTCILLLHPDVERQFRAAVSRAIADLRYGLVAINAWGGLGFACEVAHWGGYQGSQTVADPVSGIGSAHNCYLFDHVQKTVFRSPFICGLHPKPRHVSPILAVPYKLSPTWLWRLGRGFAGWIINGVPGIKSGPEVEGAPAYVNPSRSSSDMALKDDGRWARPSGKARLPRRSE